MKRNAICSLTLLMLCLPITPRSASAFDGDQTGALSGHWSGVFGSDVLDSEVDPAEVDLELFVARNRVYQGQIGLSFIPGEPYIPSEPTRLVSAASGRISLTSQTSNWTLNAHGYTDGEMLVLNYHINFRNGVQDRGLMLLWRFE